MGAYKYFTNEILSNIYVTKYTLATIHMFDYFVPWLLLYKYMLLVNVITK